MISGVPLMPIATDLHIQRGDRLSEQCMENIREAKGELSENDERKDWREPPFLPRHLSVSHSQHMCGVKKLRSMTHLPGAVRVVASRRGTQHPSDHHRHEISQRIQTNNPGIIRSGVINIFVRLPLQPLPPSPYSPGHSASSTTHCSSASSMRMSRLTCKTRRRDLRPSERICYHGARSTRSTGLYPSRIRRGSSLRALCRLLTRTAGQ